MDSNKKNATLDMTLFREHSKYFKLRSLFPPLKPTYKKIKSHYLTILLICQYIYLEKLKDIYNISNWDEYASILNKKVVKSISVLIKPFIYIILRKMNNKNLLQIIGKLQLKIDIKEEEDMVVIFF